MTSISSPSRSAADGAVPDFTDLEDGETVLATDTSPEETARAIASLEQAGYKVLAPFRGGPRRYAATHCDGAGLYVDTESTGSDVQVDEIIQLALVPFFYDRASGQIGAVGEAVTMYEMPGRSVSPEALAVHGITPDRLVGQRFDDERVRAMAFESDIIVAHNADFDRPMLDRRFPALPARPWGCTYRDVPWRAAGYASASLGALLMQHAGHHFVGHDAAADCYAAIECLAHPLPDRVGEEWPFDYVLRQASALTKRLFAVGAPFESKDALQQRGYRWNDPSKAGATHPRGHKAWWREVALVDYETELTWLDARVYHGTARLHVHVVDVPPTERFARATVRGG